MNQQKHPLKQAVKTYYAEQTLSDKQLNCLQLLEKTTAQAQNNARSRPFSTAKLITSIAASLLLSFIVLTYSQTPALITAAYADIKMDTEINNGLQPAMKQWLTSKTIALVPPQYEIEMSKFCQLKNYKTTHLRIAGEQQGTLHLFFHNGKRPFHWLNRSGQKDQMHWQLIKVRDDLTVVLMHTPDMRKQAVQHILAKILPELAA